MKVLVDIKDSKASFVMELLKYFPFVKVMRLPNEKDQLIAEIKEAVKELKLVRSGKKKARDAKELLNEL